MGRPWLYVAGPYSQTDPVLNTHRAVRVSSALLEHTDWVPICPHLTLLWHLVDPHPINWWYDYDLQMLERCDAIVRLPGLSTGADREVDIARTNHKQQIKFTDLPDVVTKEWWGD